MKRMALALMLLSAPAMAMAQDAQIDTVTVHGSSMTGFWHIDFPAGISISVPMVVRTLHGTYGGHDAFCRMEEGREAFAVRCLPWNGGGTGSLEDGNLHLAWGVALFRFVIDAPLATTTAFTGTYKLKMFGIGHEAAMPTTGRKLAPSAAAPDTAGQGAALLAALQAIANGSAPPLDDTRRRMFGTLFGGAPATTAVSLQGLGAPMQAIYLGASAFSNGFHLYDVEFSSGQQRLCGVNTEDGKPAVLCV